MNAIKERCNDYVCLREDLFRGTSISVDKSAERFACTQREALAAQHHAAGQLPRAYLVPVHPRATVFSMRALAFILIAKALLGGCTPRAYHRATIATLAVAEASLACDWGQTEGMAGTGWRWNYESNPMLGPAPSGGSISVYFAAVGVGLAVASKLLPEKVAPFVFGAVALIEAKTIATNAAQSQFSTHLCRY